MNLQPQSQSQPECPECDATIDRRMFLRAAGTLALTTAVQPWLARAVYAGPTPASAAETAVGRFYASLSDEQKKTIVFGFDNDLRKKISANWHITKPILSESFYTNEQRDLVDQIVRKVTSEDGYERIRKQTGDDDSGLDSYSVAVFGTPGSGKFEFELTGRHLTLRADGDSVDKAAFGGPIVYGHGNGDPSKNLFHYQTQQTNEVFKALDPKQAEKALIAKAPNEAAVQLQGEKGTFPGISVSELSSDQKALVEKTLKTLLAPYRQEDVDEVIAILKATGGVEKLHMAFYQQEDLLDDKKWDLWRIEGPSFAWHFRGAPHVHAYINIAQT